MRYVGREIRAREESVALAWRALPTASRLANLLRLRLEAFRLLRKADSQLHKTWVMKTTTSGMS
jgi:hypothetical protein